MPKLSVVMPTYNQGRYIQETLNSILTQTFKDFELIIVNDGSTDDTDSIIKKNLHDPRIQYIVKSNGGTGSSLNEGFKYATGKYETWFASDNVLFPNAFQVLNDYLDGNSNIDYVYSTCEIRTMDETGSRVVSVKPIQAEVNSQYWNREKLQMHYFLGIVWLWRRDLRLKSGEFQLEPCEDYYFIFQMVAAGAKFEFINANLGWFRRHPQNMTHKITRENPKQGRPPHYYSSLVQEKGLELWKKAGIV